MPLQARFPRTVWKVDLQQHGHYTIMVTGRIMFLEILEAWNLETALRFCADQEQAAKALVGAPWAILSDLTGWQLSTPNVAEQISRQAVRLDTLGRTHNAIISNDHGMRQMLLAEAIKSGTRHPNLEFFDDQTSALAWLSDCGFDP